MIYIQSISINIKLKCPLYRIPQNSKESALLLQAKMSRSIKFACQLSKGLRACNAATVPDFKKQSALRLIVGNVEYDDYHKTIKPVPKREHKATSIPSIEDESRQSALQHIMRWYPAGQ